MSQNIHKLRINEFKVIMISNSIYGGIIILLLSFIGFYSIYFFSLVTSQRVQHRGQLRQAAAAQQRHQPA